MAVKRTPIPRLPPVDELGLFDGEGREKQNNANTEIALDLIDPYPEHPFHVVHDEAMDELAESIKENGVLNPIILRPNPDKAGRYQLISGHRRVFASKLIGNETVPAQVKELDNDQAALIMVDSNLQQRQELLPSEKAFAYKMKLDVLRRQGQRVDLTSSQVGMKSQGRQSLDELGETVGESRNQIHRYIRLAELTPEFLNMVDEGKLKFMPAVSLSYLSHDFQSLVFNFIEAAKITPSIAQANEIREAAEKGELNRTVLQLILEGDKPKAKGTIKTERFREFFSPADTVAHIEDTAYNAVAFSFKAYEYFPDGTTQEAMYQKLLVMAMDYHKNQRMAIIDPIIGS